MMTGLRLVPRTLSLAPFVTASEPLPFAVGVLATTVPFWMVSVAPGRT